VNTDYNTEHLSLENLEHQDKRSDQFWMPPVATEQELQRIRDGWEDYIRRRSWCIFAFLSWIPLGLVVGLRVTYLGLPDRLSPVFLFPWMLLFIVVGIRYQLWKCPRCSKGFAYKGWYNKSYFARKCVLCDLSKDEMAKIAQEAK
jgi:hypothetical protein